MKFKLTDVCIGVGFGSLTGYGLYVAVCKMFHFMMGREYWSVQAGGPAFLVYAPIYIPVIIGLIIGSKGMGDTFREKLYSCLQILVTSCVGIVVFLLFFLALSLCMGIYNLLGGWPGIIAALIVGCLLLGGIGAGAGSVLIIFFN